jgi:hypothetical protein
LRFKFMLVGAAVALVSMMSVAMAAKPAHPTIVRFDLTGAAIGDVTPAGKAISQVTAHNSRLRVGVRHVNLPGATLDVVVDGVDVGDITLNEDGNGFLVLRSRFGDAVPAVTHTSKIEVRNQADASVVVSN